MFQRFHEVKVSQEAEMMPAGDGSRSSTPGSVVDGRVMFASHSSPLNSPTLASYPPISSPQPSGPPLGSHTLFSGAARYTPPPCGAHRYVSETSTYRLVGGSDAVPDPGGTRYLMDPYRHQDLQRVPVEYHRAGDEIYHNNHPIDLQRSPNATPINFQTATSIDHHRAPNSTPIDLQRAPNGISIDLEQRSPSDANSVSFHRAPSIDIQRVLNGTPIDLQRPQSATLIDYQRAHSANSTDFHRTQSAASVEFQRAPHGNSINLQRGTNGTSMDLHRSSSTTSVDLQRVSNSQQQLLNAQRLVSELQRVQGGPQQRQRIHDSSRVSEIPAIPVSTSSEPLQRHEVHSNSLSSSSMYRVLSEPLHSPAEVVPQRAILRGTHADPQRLVQESFRGYFTSQRHALSEGRSLGDTRLVVAGEDLRYAPPDRVEDERYAGGHLMGEEPSHTMMPENLRIGNQQLMPENLCGARGADTPHSAIAPEVLRGAAGGAETPHSMITENLRGTPDASRMVPENLCLSEPTHHPQGISGVAQPLSSSNGDVAAGRMLNHSQGSAESPMPLMRPQYDPSPHKMIVEASVPPRSQSPPYSDIIYRNDLHGTFGSHLAPPTPAPSVPPSIPDQVSTTTLPQYYSPYPPHSTPSVHQYPPYISEEPDSMSLEEKIERGYQDIKPFDQDYPVSMPMMHMSQDILQVPPPTAAKPPKPKKPKEPKPPRLPIIHKCNECLRVFKNSTQLKNHMWRHTGEKPFTCDECGSKFTQQGNLRAHRRIHTGERPYQCPECKACFTQLSTLKTHQKIHSDERPYKCSECDAAFRQVANLKTHQVTHTGERPHKCDQCDKAFTQKSNLKAHKNRVHYGEGISVPVKRGRKKIPAAIKPFECPECGARFTVLSNLKIHSKLHSGDKQLECEACGAGFAQRSNLRNHMQRIHGRPPPIQAPKRRIKCDECPAMFKLRRCLKTHKRRRHPIKSLKIKILRESRYHLNSSLVEALPEEEDDNEEEDGSLLDSMAPSLDQSHTDGEDVYESGFNSTDEDSIAHFQRDNQGDLPSSAAEPIVQIREPKVERPDSPLSPETTSLPLIGGLEAKQEVFDNPGGTSMGPASGIGHKNFFQMETHSALPSLHTDHPLAVEVNDVYTRNDCGEASSRSLSCENAALNHPLSSNFESKDISVRASEGS